MARGIGRLSALSVAKAAQPGRYSDGGNLYLVVDQSRAKRWTFFFSRQGRQREMGLGSINAVSLAKARQLAAECRALLAEGIDPIAARKAVKGAPTFGEFAETYISGQASGWRGNSHARHWRNSLRDHAKPILAMRVDAIGRDEVLRCLTPLWTAKPETARRVRNRIEIVLDAAKAAGHRTGENPARWRGGLEHALARPPKVERSHFPALPFDDVPAFVEELRKRPSMASFALEFLILTAARISEVLGATWNEIDIAGKVWSIPAARMKAGRVHRVPLSDRALEVLAAAARLRSGDFVFPGGRARRPLSQPTVRDHMRRMGVVGPTVHGFRSGFRDFCGERTHFPREVAEQALAHTVGDQTERAYRRFDALEKRRELMEAWARFCSSSPAPVIQLRPGASAG
jgi:integrase